MGKESSITKSVKAQLEAKKKANPTAYKSVKPVDKTKGKK